MNPSFSNTYTSLQKAIINRLAEDACAGCGGEDCACCEIWHDRQKWCEPYELFAEDPCYHNYLDCEGCGEIYREEDWCIECDYCIECCDCDVDN